MTESIPSFDIGINVEIRSAHSHSDVAPLLDALNEYWAYVDSSRSSFDPPAAGPELALVDLALYASAGVTAQAVWHLFFDRVVSAAGGRIQAHIAEMIRRGANKSDHFCALSITCFGVRLYVESELSSGELDRCLREARELGARLSDEDFEVGPGTINGYYWDRQRRLWVPASEWRFRTTGADRGIEE